jgi:hypothetical protein
MIDVFLSRPNWVPSYVERQLVEFYSLLNELDFNPKTIGTNIEPLLSPFEEVLELMNKCQCTIVLGIPQLLVTAGKNKGKDIDKSFSLLSEWNQIEAAISIMLKKPTLILLHKRVATIGLFQKGAANVFIHEFDTLGPGWIEKTRPKLKALKHKV